VKWVKVFSLFVFVSVSLVLGLFQLDESVCRCLFHVGRVPTFVVLRGAFLALEGMMAWCGLFYLRRRVLLRRTRTNVKPAMKKTKLPFF
jgi:hypothetical protein